VGVYTQKLAFLKKNKHFKEQFYRRLMRFKKFRGIRMNFQRLLSSKTAEGLTKNMREYLLLDVTQIYKI